MAGAAESDGNRQGPIAQAIRALSFDQIMLLADDESELRQYSDWLNSWSEVTVEPVFAAPVKTASSR